MLLWTNTPCSVNVEPISTPPPQSSPSQERASVSPVYPLPLWRINKSKVDYNFFYPFFFLGCVCVCVGVSGEIEPDEPLLTTDVPTWIGVGVGLLVFAALTCMVFKLFSRARFSPARAYGNANLPPPLTPTGSISNHNLFTRNSI